MAAQGATVLAALAACLLAGGPALELPRPAWQPRSAAFAIWGAIYTLIFQFGLTLLWHPQRWPAVAALAAALACCAAWLVAVGRAAWAASAACLVAALVLAATGLALLGPFDLRTPHGWALSAGPSLLCGWLGVAAALGISLPRLAAGVDAFPAWTVLVSGGAAAAVAAARGAPLAGLVLLWTAAFLPPTVPGVRAAAIVLGVASSAAATVVGMPRQ